MKRYIKTLIARARLWIADVDLEWAHLDGSAQLINRKRAAYNSALAQLVTLENFL